MWMVKFNLPLDSVFQSRQNYNCLVFNITWIERIRGFSWVLPFLLLVLKGLQILGSCLTPVLFGGWHWSCTRTVTAAEVWVLLIFFWAPQIGAHYLGIQDEHTALLLRCFLQKLFLRWISCDWSVPEEHMAKIQEKQARSPAFLKLSMLVICVWLLWCIKLILLWKLM